MIDQLRRLWAHHRVDQGIEGVIAAARRDIAESTQLEDLGVVVERLAIALACDSFVLQLDLDGEPALEHSTDFVMGAPHAIDSRTIERRHELRLMTRGDEGERLFVEFGQSIGQSVSLAWAARWIEPLIDELFVRCRTLLSQQPLGSQAEPSDGVIAFAPLRRSA